ncbi:MAG: PAS domain-containing protein [Deltaproteobacteria bacterium]|nr:PAS domain-containing protein [Deltaproteobacteria bacterium]
MERGDPFRGIVESSPLAILYTDERGVITACNRSATELFAAPPEKLIGFSYEQIRDERMRSAIRRALSGERTRFEGKYLTVTGNVLREMSAHFAPSFSEGGAVSGVVGIFEDVAVRTSAEREREELIRQLRRALSDLTGLSGLLPICARCKSIREADGEWTHLENYLQKHAGAEFTHSLCPACARETYPELC